mmetsp:Transcript_40534/g.75965  ORF Transcript_40534/g.75965 Transcript_40534/m.75965 type:complete len:486 (+) Transcript_40534:97-1554(+)
MNQQKKDAPLLREVIENVGFGFGQIRLILTGCTIWIADGSELLLLSSVTRALTVEWNMDVWQRSVILSVVFIGVFIGNLLSGLVGDRYGRRLPILISFGGVFVFSLMSALSQNFQAIICTRIMVGASFGIGQPSCFSLAGEISPSYYRIHMMALLMSLFHVGELYSAFLIWMDDPTLQTLHWRWLVCMGAMPSAVFLAIAIPLLTESPSFLLVKGREAEAREVVHELFKANGCLDATVDFQPPPVQNKGQETSTLKVVFGMRLLYSTLVVCFSIFTLNFLFYGGLYAFPQVLPHMKLHVSPAASLMFSSVAGLVGILIGTILGMYFPRKACMVIYLFLVAGFTMTFTTAASDQLVPELLDAGEPFQIRPVSGLSETLLLIGLMGMKVTIAIGFQMVTLYAAEIYPTVARATGLAISTACGRLGAILCPAVFEQLSHATGGHTMFFHVMVGLCFVNALLVLFLPFETRGQLLQDHEEEGEPIVKSA